MMRAASTASGRSVNSGVKATTVTIARTHATTLDISDFAPAPSLTADCDRLPPAASPFRKPEPMLAKPRATSSWLGSRR